MLLADVLLVQDIAIGLPFRLWGYLPLPLLHLLPFLLLPSTRPFLWFPNEGTDFTMGTRRRCVAPFFSATLLNIAFVPALLFSLARTLAVLTMLILTELFTLVVLRRPFT